MIDKLMRAIRGEKGVHANSAHIAALRLEVAKLRDDLNVNEINLVYFRKEILEYIFPNKMKKVKQPPLKKARGRPRKVKKNG